MRVAVAGVDLRLVLGGVLVLGSVPVLGSVQVLAARRGPLRLDGVVAL